MNEVNKNIQLYYVVYYMGLLQILQKLISVCMK